MATSIQFVNGKKGLEKVYIKGCTLMYTKINKCDPIFNQKDLPKHKQNQFEYSTVLVVDEDTYDLYVEQFPKQSAKTYLKAAFMKQYKIEKDEDFPEGLDPKSKKFYTLTVKQNTHYEEYKDGNKTGNVLPLSAETRPRAVLVKPDGKKEDITITTNIGNGSVGDVLLTVTHNKTYGASAKLKGVLVTSLVAYESSGNSDLTDFFGDDVEFAELPEEVEVSSNGKQSDEDSGSDFDDEDLPFELDEDEGDF